MERAPEDEEEIDAPAAPVTVDPSAPAPASASTEQVAEEAEAGAREVLAGGLAPPTVSSTPLDKTKFDAELREMDLPAKMLEPAVLAELWQREIAHRQQPSSKKATLHEAVKRALEDAFRAAHGGTSGAEATRDERVAWMKRAMAEAVGPAERGPIRNRWNAWAFILLAKSPHTVRSVFGDSDFYLVRLRASTKDRSTLNQYMDAWKGKKDGVDGGLRKSIDEEEEDLTAEDDLGKRPAPTDLTKNGAAKRPRKGDEDEDIEKVEITADDATAQILRRLAKIERRLDSLQKKTARNWDLTSNVVDTLSVLKDARRRQVSSITDTLKEIRDEAPAEREREEKALAGELAEASTMQERMQAIQQDESNL